MPLSWLEQRIYDALADVTLSADDICQAIERAERDYRTTASSVGRALKDLERRGLVRSVRAGASLRWSRVAGVSDEIEEQPRQAPRLVRSSQLSSCERHVLRCLRAEGRAMGVVEIAAATGAPRAAVTRSLARLVELGGVEMIADERWKAINAD